MNNWISVKERLPEVGKVVQTKVDDESGEHNHADLKRFGSLWFLADGSMYIYSPTHWMPLPEPPKP
jgi:hypothetical protein